MKLTIKRRKYWLLVWLHYCNTPEFYLVPSTELPKGFVRLFRKAHTKLLRADYKTAKRFSGSDVAISAIRNALFSENSDIAVLQRYRCDMPHNKKLRLEGTCITGQKVGQ